MYRKTEIQPVNKIQKAKTAKNSEYRFGVQNLHFRFRIRKAYCNEQSHKVVDTNYKQWDFGNKHSLFYYISVRLRISRRPKSLLRRTHGQNGWYIQLNFCKMKNLYFKQFAVRSSISELEAVMLYDYGRTDGHSGSYKQLHQTRILYSDYYIPELILIYSSIVETLRKLM